MLQCMRICVRFSVCVGGGVTAAAVCASKDLFDR